MQERYQRCFSYDAPSIYNELPPLKTDSIIKWLMETVFKTRYIFYDKKKHEAICSHCGEIQMPQDVKHNQMGQCPKCGYKARLKSRKIGREKLEERIRVLIFQKKGKSVYATTNFIYADYSEGKIKLYKDIDGVFKFSRKEQQGYQTSYSSFYGGDWKPQKNIGAPYRTGRWLDVPLITYTKNLKQAFKGTDLQYCELPEQGEECNSWYFLKLVDLNAKYQSIEKLHKAGFDQFIEDKITNKYGSGAVKWKNNNLKDILGLNKEEMLNMKEYKFNLEELETYKLARKMKIAFRYECKKEYNVKALRDIKRLAAYAPVSKIVKYIRGQIRQTPLGHFTTNTRDFKDYIRECEILEFDLKDKQILFPKNLRSAHQRTSAQIRVEASEVEDKAIKKQAKKFSKYKFSQGNLCIRVAESAKEIIEEGIKQKHCVGGYVEAVAQGTKWVFFLRRIGAEEEPYYTLELNKSKGGYVVRQCRAKGNGTLTEAEEKAKDEFIKKWLEDVVNKKKERKVA